jgi:sugar O-acyltransferase (sialic acid O-acetyltransferase NeuD family)
MNQLFGVFGASGCGRGVMPILKARETSAEMVFVDDALAGGVANGHEILTLDQFCRMGANNRQIVIAVADPSARMEIALRCESADIPFFSARSEHVVEMDDVEIGEGSILSPFVTLTSNIRIGSHFHCNIGSYVEHDCVIGDFVTFAPGVQCNGNVHIGDGAYIGAGAVIKQGRPGEPLCIGSGAVIGMGAVVTRPVAAGATVIGNPARDIKRANRL